MTPVDGTPTPFRLYAALVARIPCRAFATAHDHAAWPNMAGPVGQLIVVMQSVALDACQRAAGQLGVVVVGPNDAGVVLDEVAMETGGLSRVAVESVDVLRAAGTPRCGGAEPTRPSPPCGECPLCSDTRPLFEVRRPAGRRVRGERPRDALAMGGTASRGPHP